MRGHEFETHLTVFKPTLTVIGVAGGVASGVGGGVDPIRRVVSPRPRATNLIGPGQLVAPVVVCEGLFTATGVSDFDQVSSEVVIEASGVRFRIGDRRWRGF